MCKNLKMWKIAQSMALILELGWKPAPVTLCQTLLHCGAICSPTTKCMAPMRLVLLRKRYQAMAMMHPKILLLSRQVPNSMPLMCLA